MFNSAISKTEHKIKPMKKSHRLFLSGSPSGFGRKTEKTLVGFLVATLLFSTPAFAQTPNFEKLADAIYKAEGGSKTRHPYGILKKYKVTTPRQACINTCKHAWKDFQQSNVRISYIEFLQRRYCPIGAANDPTGLNKNWLKNVSNFYEGA